MRIARSVLVAVVAAGGGVAWGEAVYEVYDTPQPIADGQAVDVDGDGVSELTFTRVFHPDPSSLPTGQVTTYFSQGFVPAAGLGFLAAIEVRSYDPLGGDTSLDYAVGEGVGVGTAVDEGLNWLTYTELEAAATPPGLSNVPAGSVEVAGYWETTGGEQSYATSESFFLAMRWAVDEGYRYGWLNLRFDRSGDGAFPLTFELLGSGYETEAGAGIEARLPGPGQPVPTPAGLAAGAALMGAGLTRRRR